MKRAILTALIALIAGASLVLSACGGGGCNPCEPDAPPPRVDCQAKPEACK